MNPTLKTYAEKYRANLLDSVVPFWLRHGLDRELDGYLCGLDGRGDVYDDRKFIWLQGRGVWTFSRLYNEVEPREEWLDAARSGLRFIDRHARGGDGRYLFATTRDGRPHTYQRKPWGAFFCMIGMLELARATADDGLRDRAFALGTQVADWMADPTLLGRPPRLDGQTPLLSLADAMVMGTMALETDRSTPGGRLDLVERALDRALGQLDRDRSLFMENVPLDGPRRGPSGPDERLLNPGHSIELAWIVIELARRAARPAAARTAADAISATFEAGWDERYGGLYYFVDVEGRPPLQLEASQKLWWPHAEAIYACVLAYSETGDAAFLDRLAVVDDYVSSHFVDPVDGEWFGYLDRRGERTSDLKGGPYKGFFHVPRALMFSAAEIEQLVSVNEQGN